mmetsp:Transcript_10759/g.13141  ORF Transcript_10759/g.13141 Transcript_10759/m.13141 type:complete len:235 (-) Transcript_10759:86-790(-)
MATATQLQGPHPPGPPPPPPPSGTPPPPRSRQLHPPRRPPAGSRPSAPSRRASGPPPPPSGAPPPPPHASRKRPPQNYGNTVANKRSSLSRMKPPTDLRDVKVFLKKAQIGQGSYGSVFMGEDTQNSKEIVALKRINAAQEENGFPITSIREIKILKALNHPNIVILKEMVTSKGSFIQAIATIYEIMLNSSFRSIVCSFERLNSKVTFYDVFDFREVLQLFGTLLLSSFIALH